MSKGAAPGATGVDLGLPRTIRVRVSMMPVRFLCLKNCLKIESDFLQFLYTFWTPFWAHFGTMLV